MHTSSAVLQPQPVDGPDSAARGNIAFPPFLWMPHSPAETTQQGLPRAGSQGTASANVGLRSVNQLHGLASPPQNAVSGSQVSADQAEAGLQWQHLSSKDAAAAGSSKSESGLHPAYQPDRHQQPSPDCTTNTARFTFLAAACVQYGPCCASAAAAAAAAAAPAAPAAPAPAAAAPASCSRQRYQHTVSGGQSEWCAYG